MQRPSHDQASLKWRIAQFLERRWWKQYLHGKSSRAYLSDKRAYWKRVLEEMDYEAAAGANCLDAGCGPAGIFLLLHERQKITALDPLLEAYAKDLDIFSKSDYPSVNFITAPLESAELANAPFAAIYCFNAINHVADWSRALDQLTAWSAPGTVLLLSSDVHRRRWLNWIFCRLPGDALHPQQHDREAYRKALTQRGWVIESELLLRREWIFDYVGWKAVRRET